MSFIVFLLCANVQALQVEKVSLLELYSSEGCSSCPPAEKSLYDLISHKDLWKKFVPINFHVDYWNRLGWVDVFSSKKFTDRQRDYANLWKTDRVYTPAFVVNGAERGSSLPALSESSAKSNVRIGIEKVSEHLLNIRVTSQNKSQFKLNFALLANGLESVVKSGENKGRTLKHNFVVMELIEEPIKEINMFKITKPKVPYKSLSYAVWVSSKTTAEVIQATGGDL
jgi:hypothetical protein